MRDWTGHLVVLGLGSSGLAVADWGLARASDGVRVAVVDSAAGPKIEQHAQMLRARGATVRLGCDDLDAADVKTADLVVASPGIHPASPLLASARALGAPIISEIELAYRISRAPWVAVTGTNGKTTTTALVTHLLQEAGFVAEAVGNIGRPAVNVATELDATGMIVAEVSSFQLVYTDTFHPRVSVLLNITPDHIDYHGSFEAYAAEKGKVFARQGAGDTAVIDIDDPGSRAYADPVESRDVLVRRVSLKRRQRNGAYLEGKALVLDEQGEVHELVEVDRLAIRGEHNFSNALAAAAAARAVGASLEAIRSGLSSFKPIEHRLESVRIVAGVEYVNDSKATNPDAVCKALTAFADRSVVLLLGGRNKGVDLGPLASNIAGRVRDVVAFGEAAPELEDVFERVGMKVMPARGLSEAVALARSAAHPGDVVLLSPGCTSFDEFDSYEERGRVFKQIVARMDEQR